MKRTNAFFNACKARVKRSTKIIHPFECFSCLRFNEIFYIKGAQKEFGFALGFGEMFCII